MNSRIAALMSMAACLGLPTLTKGDLTLGTAGNFAVLAGTSVTNTGATMVNGGDIGVDPGTSISGFPVGALAPPYHYDYGDVVAAKAVEDLSIAYATAVALAPTRILTGQDLGSMTLTPGIYSFSSSAQLTGILTLNDLGDTNAQFVFQIGTTLTTATASSVLIVDNNGVFSTDNQVFWQVGSSATIGAGTTFEGHILAETSITFNVNATDLDGSALAINGAVALDTNRIYNPISVPEPASMTLVLSGGAVAVLASLRGSWPCRSRDRGSVLLRGVHGDRSSL